MDVCVVCRPVSRAVLARLTHGERSRPERDERERESWYPKTLSARIRTSAQFTSSAVWVVEGTMRMMQSRSVFCSFFAGSHCEQFWHGQGRPLFDVVHPAFPLPTTAICSRSTKQPCNKNVGEHKTNLFSNYQFGRGAGGGRRQREIGEDTTSDWNVKALAITNRMRLFVCFSS